MRLQTYLIKECIFCESSEFSCLGECDILQCARFGLLEQNFHVFCYHFVSDIHLLKMKM